MICEVTFHRRNGQRLKKSEVAPAILADMQMHEMADEHSNMRRTVRRLTLTEHPGNSLRIFAVLIDPVIVGWKTNPDVYLDNVYKKGRPEMRTTAIGFVLAVWDFDNDLLPNTDWVLD